MPIAWDLIAAMYRAPLRMQTLEITRALERLALWLEARVLVAEALERRSRGFPVAGFYDEALTLWVDPSQHGALQQLAERGVGQALAASGRAFAAGIGRVGQAITEELLLPRLLDRIGGVLGAIVASLERFIPARAGMFDVGARTASDLVGEAGLALRTLVESTGPLRALAGDLGRALRVLGEALAEGQAVAPGTAVPGAAAGDGANAKPGGGSLAEALDRRARYVLAGILGLPILPEWIARLWSAASASLRFAVLEAFQRVEGLASGLRRDIFHVFSRDLPALIVKAMRVVAAVWVVVDLHWRFYVNVGLAYGSSLLAHLHSFTRGLETFLNYWIGVINGIISAIDAVLDFDLAPLVASYVLGSLVSGGLGSLGVIPRFTIRDAVSLGTSAEREAFRHWLVKQLAALELDLEVAEVGAEVWSRLDPVGWVLGEDLADAARAARFRVGAARRLVSGLLRARAPLPAETAVPFALPTGFPDVAATMLGPSPEAALQAALGSTRAALQGSVRNVLADGASFLAGVSEAFDRAAGRAASLGSPEQWRRIAEGSVTLEYIASGDQVSRLRDRIASRQQDPVTASFEGWLARGGFTVVGTTIPLYVQQMDLFWRERVAAGEAPSFELTATSPHKLVRRAALGRVRVPELTIRAHGRPAATELATDVAGRFQAAVTGAYVEGKRVLAARAETARRAELAEAGQLSPTE
jgi:hypothetical protein